MEDFMIYFLLKNKNCSIKNHLFVNNVKKNVLVNIVNVTRMMIFIESNAVVVDFCNQNIENC
jgi:deoxyxylulose-5-phosphate synthase